MDDYISKQTLKAKMFDLRSEGKSYYDAIDDVNDLINSLSSIELSTPRGEWKVVKIGTYMCSLCGAVRNTDSLEVLRYCNWCGARMSFGGEDIE